MWTYNYATELCHHGTKGMKWGVRRYQNADGSLTNQGKSRYENEAKRNNWEMGSDGIARGTGKKNKGERHEADPDKWVKEDISNTKKLTEDTAKATRQLRDLNSESMRNAPKVRMDLSKMSDKEMREKINRELLERQYNDVFAPKKQQKGREFADKTLKYAGTTLALTSTALGIALAIKELKQSDISDMDSNELYHHGTKGMKWGVRRYQNPDGSLTKKGAARIDKMSPNKVQKKAQKWVRSARREKYGNNFTNAWHDEIGENSKKSIDKRNSDERADPNLKFLNKEYKKFNKKHYNDDPSDYEAAVNKFYNSKQYLAASNALNKYGGVLIDGKSDKEFLKSYGKDITQAYLKDLGFNDKTSKLLEGKIRKSGTTIGTF